MAESSPGPAHRPSPSPDPEPTPTESSSRADDPLLVRWMSHTFSEEDWRALEAERADVVDGLVDAWERDDAARVRELGARLVWGWVSSGGAQKDGLLLSFDDAILKDDNDDVLRYLEGSVSARRMKALENGARWTEREQALAHRRAAEGYFKNACDTDRHFEIVPVESRDGTQIFVAHIMEGDYPCASYFAGAADSIDEAMEVVKELGYVSADDLRQRYPATRVPGAAAVTVEMIENEKRRTLPPVVPPTRGAAESIPENSRRPTTYPAVIAPTRWVVYRDACDGKLVIFADVDTAVHEDAIYSALRESDTWGEFRRRLPAGEWPAIAERLFSGEDEVEDEDRSHWEDDNAPFMRELVQGIDDSYPPVRSEWLGNLEDFPNAVITAYNEVLVFSPYHPVHWQIPAERAEAVAALLREGGYLVERADFLEFS